MKKTKNYAMPYPEQDDYFNVEDFQDMMVSVDNLMKKLSDSGAQISSDAEHLYNQTKAQMDNIQKRMNAFTALRDGSTTGDAELKDIRVAYDGKEFRTVGEFADYMKSLLDDSYDKFEEACHRLIDYDDNLDVQFESWLLALGKKKELNAWREAIQG